MNVQINVMPPCLQFKNKLQCHKSQIIGIINIHESRKYGYYINKWS